MSVCGYVVLIDHGWFEHVACVREAGHQGHHVYRPEPSVSGSD